MPKFRKKAVVITAEQFNSVTNPQPFGAVSRAGGRYVLTTLSGIVQVDDGDWIIDNTPTRAGDYYPVKPDVFAALYEPVQ